ncbi:MAG: hypothetical protein HYU36_17025, partial [Planctomycetes bacterium]|nr:hypothetical protein [Planctomycetota bacterium]
MSDFELQFAFGCPAWLRPWLPPAWVEWIPLALFLAAILACVALAHRLYARTAPVLERRSLWLLLSLRCLAMTILVLFLFRPEVTYREGEKPLLGLLIDASRSMNVRDHPDLPDRLEQVKSVLLHPPSELRSILGRFELRFFAFDVGSREIPGREVVLVAATGDGTFLARSVQEAVAALGAQRLGGLVLFSDGADNSAADPVEEVDGLGAPLSTVGVGTILDRKERFRDVRLADLEAPKVVTLNQLAQVHAYVEASGFRDEMATVSLIQDGRELAQERVVLDDRPGAQKVTFSHAPHETGSKEYRVAVSALPSEQIEENNHRSFRWEVKDAPIRVLYVEGKPRSEFKFLKRVLEQHEATQVLSLLKVGPSQFLQQGGVEGVKDILGFPQDRETLEKFDVIILGSIDRSHFSAMQLENLKEVVSAGAGFLMLGGYESFGGGDYLGTAVEEMLPVRLGPEDPGQEKEPFVPSLTAEGKEHPIFFGISDFFPSDGQPALKALPPLLGCNRTLSAKPGASVLAVHPAARSSSGPYPMFGPLRRKSLLDKGWFLNLALHRLHESFLWAE